MSRRLVIRACAFTRAAAELGVRLGSELRRLGHEYALSAPERLAADFGASTLDELDSWTAAAFDEADALIFVGACGIAVRAIAPHVRDKLTDPAVLCVSEDGRFVVSLLSGHVGGANELARSVAESLGCVAVITTASDVQGSFAVDLWARDQGLALVERTIAKEVSACLLDGGEVGFTSDFAVDGLLPKGLVTCDARSDLPSQMPRLGIAVSIDDQVQPFERTLHLVPQVVSVGVGCRRGSDREAIASLVDACLAEARVSPRAVRTLATIDIKADEEGICQLAHERGWGLKLHSAAELALLEGDFQHSDFVERTVGVDNVCERAACVEGEMLLLGRRAEGGVTVALSARKPLLSFLPRHNASEQHEEAAVTASGFGPIGCSRGGSEASPQGQSRPNARELDVEAAVSATSDGQIDRLPGSGEASALSQAAERSDSGATSPLACISAEGATHEGEKENEDARRMKLSCVGLGPGAGSDLTGRARAALEAADVIVGYTSYIELIRADYPQKELVATPMRKEVERCERALAEAVRGRNVALVCSGDPGIYGMAGLVLELAEGYPELDIEVIPGITAASGGAGLLGAPLMGDWCSISLSDLMTPWEEIEQRLEAAARAGFSIVLYNPGSRGREGHLRRACDILLRQLPPDTVCGIARNVGRKDESAKVMTLERLREEQVGMDCCVFVGTTRTRFIGGRMVTPRGYRIEDRAHA